MLMPTVLLRSFTVMLTCTFTSSFAPTRFARAASSTIITAQVKARTALDEAGTKGEFLRKDSAWRNWVSREPQAKFQPEKDRYHL